MGGLCCFMKLYNRELEEIKNEDRYNNINDIVKRQIEFLSREYNIDQRMLQGKCNSLAIVER